MSWYSQIGEYTWVVIVLGTLLIMGGFAAVVRAFTKDRGGRR